MNTQEEVCLHLGLDHNVYKLVFALGDLDDFFNQSRANSALKFRDTVQVSYECIVDYCSCMTYASAVYCGSGSNLTSATARSGV